MRAVVQRVSRARVVVGGDVVGEIEAGLCILLGVAETDAVATADRLAGRIARLRVFENEEGSRPSFTHAAPPDLAEPLYQRFCDALRELGITVATGEFGARMDVELTNDGPVTIVLEAEA